MYEGFVHDLWNSPFIEFIALGRTGNEGVRFAIIANVERVLLIVTGVVLVALLVG